MISVLICTHNPRPAYLERVLAALQTQTLPKEQWELLIIDNASHDPLSSRVDLSWHQQARVIREDELGLTPARLRGIKESAGELLVFVDDDNVLAFEYLEHALAIAGEFPILGAWGGSLVGEFEMLPPYWARNYLKFLAVREIAEDLWTNDLKHSRALPIGAGLWWENCGRSVCGAVAEDPLRRALDRQGLSLMGGGDLDLALASRGKGLGFGVFCRLKVKHLISTARLSVDYLTRMVEAGTASGIIVLSLYGKRVLRRK